MALRAPSYEGGDIAPRPISAPRANPNQPIEAFGGGRAISDAFGQARAISQDQLQFIEQAKRQADADRMMEERIALNDWEKQNVYDQKTGALGQRGKNALGLGQKVNEDFDKFISEREQKLSSDEQRNAFRAMTQARREHIGKTLNHHEGQARHEIHLGSLKAATLSSIERAATDPSTIATESKIIDDNALELARSEGYDEKMTEYSRRKAQSDLHTQVIERMLSAKKDVSARGYYDLHGKNIIGNDAERIGRMVSHESMLGEAQRISDGVFSPKLEGYAVSEGVDGVREVPGAQTLKEAIDRGRAATEGKSPELRRAVDDQITYEWGLKQRAEQEANKKDMIDAANMIDGGMKFEQLPADLKDRLKPSDRKSLISYAEREPVTDDATWYTLKLMGSNEQTRQEFLNLNLMQFVGKLSKADRHGLMNWQADLREKKEKATEEAKGFLTTNGIVSLAENGVKKEHRASFTRLVNDQVLMWESKNPGKKIPPKEAFGIVDFLLSPVRKERAYWWDGEQKMYETMMQAPESEADTKRKERLLEMKEEYREKIQADFRARGIPFTQAAVFDAYEALLDREKKARDAGK